MKSTTTSITGNLTTGGSIISNSGTTISTTGTVINGPFTGTTVTMGSYYNPQTYSSPTIVPKYNVGDIIKWDHKSSMTKDVDTKHYMIEGFRVEAYTLMYALRDLENDHVTPVAVTSLDSYDEWVTKVA